MTTLGLIVPGVAAMVWWAPVAAPPQSASPPKSERAATTAVSKLTRASSDHEGQTFSETTQRVETGLRVRLEAATTVPEVLALLAAPDLPADAEEALRDWEHGLRSDLVRYGTRLQEHRRGDAAEDLDHRLEEKRILEDILTTERDLATFQRGDYRFTNHRVIPDLPNFEVLRWSYGNRRYSLVRVLPRDEWSFLHQLRREIDHEAKVLAFNRMAEGTRRRVLRLREESLRDDPPEDHGWLRHWFPGDYGVDERTATIY